MSDVMLWDSSGMHFHKGFLYNPQKNLVQEMRRANIDSADLETAIDVLQQTSRGLQNCHVVIREGDYDEAPEAFVEGWRTPTEKEQPIVDEAYKRHEKFRKDANVKALASRRAQYEALKAEFESNKGK